ncbi:MAG: hypothetical protein MSG78_04340 [Clostridiales bacterium]|nr:hypothetical protein [Clostridiales bacterium]
MNGFEFEIIQTVQLPKAWQQKEAQKQLQQFLQRSWQERTIFYFDEETGTQQKFIDFDRRDGIKLQNYIGSISFLGEEMTIFPKLFQIEKGMKKEELAPSMLARNISFWLGYCEKTRFPFFSVYDSLRGKENFFELLITLYASYTRQTIDREPYLEYKTMEQKGSFIKGKIRTNEYFSHQYPNGAWNQVPYEYSELTMDHPLNQIIKQTCELLIVRTKEEENRRILNQILLKLTPVSKKNWTPDECDRIVLPIHHKAYQIVLDMSKMFLRSLGNAMECGKKQSYCFLFPAELLFESFVSGFLRQCLPDNISMITQTTDQYLANLLINGRDMGQAFRLREDIVLKNKENIVIVDTKYKEILPFAEETKYCHNKRFGISDQDIRQIAVYAVKRNAKHVFLIYPLLWKEQLVQTEIDYHIQFSERQPIDLKILKVPFLIQDNENQTKIKLIQSLEKIIREVC